MLLPNEWVGRAGFLGTAVPKRDMGCPHFLSSLPPEVGKRTFEKPCLNTAAYRRKSERVLHWMRVKI